MVYVVMSKRSGCDAEMMGSCIGTRGRHNDGEGDGVSKCINIMLGVLIALTEVVHETMKLTPLCLEWLT